MTISLRRLALLLLGLAVVGAPAHAFVCAADNVPGATLLVPYFEVDLDSCGDPPRERFDTEYSVGNTSADPVLVGVTFWSTWGVPVTGYQVYLPGLSTFRQHVGTMLCDGNAPQTNAAVSPQMAGAAPPLNYPGCNNSATPGFAPNYANPAAPPVFVTHLQQALTGQMSSSTGLFYGDDHGDQHARGYLTVETLGQCHLSFPHEPGYFVFGGVGIATNQNVLVGEWTIQDESSNFAFAEPAVALEASDVEFVPGDMTFYAPRYFPINDDNREPLPTTFASPIVNDIGIFDGIRQLVWRDRSGFPDPSPTPDFPDPLPLAKNSVIWFDEATTPFPSTIIPTLPGGPILELAEYPSVSRVYTPDDIDFQIAAGWQHSNFQTLHSTGYDGGQSWMVTLDRSDGRFQTSRAAVPLDSSCVDGGLSAKTVLLTPSTGLEDDPPTAMISWADFEDGFGGWSGVIPF